MREKCKEEVKVYRNERTGRRKSFNLKVRETGRGTLITIGETNKRNWKPVRVKGEDMNLRKG
jgi:hypothetical protein